MSTARRFMPAAFCSLTLGLLLSPAARSADPLEDAKQRREIAIQQVESDVREAVREANQLARTNPEAAIARLKQLLESIDEDTALTPERRDALKAMTKGRIRTLDAEVTRNANRGVEDARSGQRRGDGDRRSDDSTRLARGLQDVQALRAAGRNTEANQLQSDLTRRYPGSAAATAGRIIGDRNDQVTGGRRTRTEAGKGLLGTLESVDRSSIPESGDYVLPADWKTRVAKRSEGPKLTPEEKVTLKALSSPIAIDRKDMPLSGVLEYLQQTTGVNIVADKKTLESAGASYETPISVNFKRASLRTVLKKILADVGLTYIIKDASVRVVTQEEARTTMTIRSYYVGDLAGVADIRLGPLVRDIQMQAAIGQIIDSILGSIEPNSWEARGSHGGGTITYDPITMSLIIKQTAEVHYMLSGSGR